MEPALPLSHLQAGQATQASMDVHAAVEWGHVHALQQVACGEAGTWGVGWGAGRAIGGIQGKVEGLRQRAQQQGLTAEVRGHGKGLVHSRQAGRRAGRQGAGPAQEMQWH